jgi:hypothetical protein
MAVAIMAKDAIDYLQVYIFTRTDQNNILGNY